ncbi:MAG: hypothetical protein QM778_35695 [Myxococcales bacterium]
MRALVDELVDGVWVGEAMVADSKVPCAFEFALDGSYRVTNRGGDQRAFGLLFLSGPRTQVDGRYAITDLVEGKYYGYFERPLDDMGKQNLRSDLEQLVLDGDTLTFWWRSTYGDISPISVPLMLMRTR